MLFLIFLLLVNFSFALNCQELGIRLERVKTYNIYDELVQYAEGLLKNCQENESYPLALDYLLNALETIYQDKTKADSKLLKKVADKRTKNSLLMLRKTSKYKKKHPLLYSYQQLFHVVAVENRRVGDYEYTLKYAYASTQIGKAILQLK
jgi:hypothetical protein